MGSGKSQSASQFRGDEFLSVERGSLRRMMKAVVGIIVVDGGGGGRC